MQKKLIYNLENNQTISNDGDFKHSSSRFSHSHNLHHRVSIFCTLLAMLRSPHAPHMLKTQNYLIHD